MRARLWLAVLALVAPLPARAVGLGGIAMELGAGAAHTEARIYRLSLVLPWRERPAGADWGLGGYWEVDAGGWRVPEPNDGHRTVAAVGFAPVLRLQRQRPWFGSARPYFDAGLGLQWLSSRRSGRENLSTRFQFSPRLGFGLALRGARRSWILGYEHLHMSNADTRLPNPGVDFHVLRVAVRF